MIFAIVPAIFACETIDWRKGKEFRVELTKAHIKWAVTILFKD